MAEPRSQSEDAAGGAEPLGHAAQHQRSGALYLVGTPIGNLEDITLRALRILREAEIIACEDTRHTRKLLNRYQIATPTISYQEHNEAERAPELVARLRAGASVALVSDAGTPAVSDPGLRLIRLCIDAGIRVVPVPGASAVLAALIASGLPTHPFQFAGFPPAKRAQRRKFLAGLSAVHATKVIFEAPHRIAATLADVIEVIGDCQAVLARELTKMHEEFLRGRCSQILRELQSRPRIQGEMTLVLAPQEANAAVDPNQPLRQRVEELMRGGLNRMEALKAVARERGISKSQAYRQYEA